MKPEVKVSGSAALAVLEKLNKQLEDFYYELDELRYSIVKHLEWLDKLRDETSCLIDEVDPNEAVDPEVAQKIGELVDQVDYIYSETSNLSDTMQALCESAECFDDFKPEWQELVDEAAFEDEVTESES